MKVVVLTSSRADYGIYLPLLKALNDDDYFDLHIIAFGTHLSTKHGYTCNQIEKDGFVVKTKIDTMLEGDLPSDISKTIGVVVTRFADVWNALGNDLDLVFCLGDRYEMFAAITSIIPFGIPVAHIHGGETTIGAIDNVFRHSMTLMSTYHFVSAEVHAEKVAALMGTSNNIFNVGALSLDNLNEIKLYTKEEFNDVYGILLDNPVLVTFHPETVNFEANEEIVNELISALTKLEKQIILTLPNADTKNDVVRTALLQFASESARVHVVESFGTKGYFSCLEYCDFVLGNSSSGIIEAASFAKYAINIGSRQKGRLAGKNVIHCIAKCPDILEACTSIKFRPALHRFNIYGDGQAAKKIVAELKKM